MLNSFSFLQTKFFFCQGNLKNNDKWLLQAPKSNVTSHELFFVQSNVKKSHVVQYGEKT